MEEVLNALKTTSAVSQPHTLVPVLRTTLRSLTGATVRDGVIPSRLVGELYGLLTANPNATLTLNVRTLLASLIREMSISIPKFFSPKFSTYSYESLSYILCLFRELNSTPTAPQNIGFLVELFSQEEAPVPLRLEALNSLIHLNAISSGCVDTIVAEYLLVPAKSVGVKRRPGGLMKSIIGGKRRDPSPVELDGSPVVDEIFSVLVSSEWYSNDQLMHVGIFSCLHSILKQRLGSFEVPPNTPVVSAPVSPTSSSVGHHAPANLLLLMESVVTLGLRILGQCQREIVVVKKSFKYIELSTTEWTREFVETTFVETLKCLDLVCRKDPSVVSLVFPMVRKVYERILLREADSPGIAIIETLKFFISHSHLVIFDLEPVLRFFFSVHIGKRLLTKYSVVLAAEAVIFLNKFANQLSSNYGDLIAQNFKWLLRLAAWYPRTVGQQVVEFLGQVSPQRVDILHSILDLPLIAAMSELSFSIDSYIEPIGDDASSVSTASEANQFYYARMAMRIVRSAEFKEISDSVLSTTGGSGWIDSDKAKNLLRDMWKGIPVTPRISAAARLVPSFLTVFFQFNSDDDTLRAVLYRYGPGRVFLFKTSDIGSVMIEFMNQSLHDETLMTRFRDEIVTAIIDRIDDPQSEDFLISLVHRIGKLESCRSYEALPLYVRTLRWILTGHKDQTRREVDIVCVRNGRVVAKPSDRHLKLDNAVMVPAQSPEVLCVVIASLTQLAIRFPQYRPQLIDLFVNQSSSDAIVKERVCDAIRVMENVSLGEQLLVFDA